MLGPPKTSGGWKPAHGSDNEALPTETGSNKLGRATEQWRQSPTLPVEVRLGSEQRLFALPDLHSPVVGVGALEVPESPDELEILFQPTIDLLIVVDAEGRQPVLRCVSIR